MQFITNRIFTGNGKRFEDYVKEHTKQEETIKTASVKVAEEEEAESSGQLKVEPLEQEGESRTMPKEGPKAKKEAEKKEKDEGPESTQIEGVEPLHQKGESTELPANPEKGKDKAGSSVKDVKEAGKKCEVCGKVCGDKDDPCKCEESKACKAKDEKEVKEAGKLPEALKEHQFKKEEDNASEKAPEKTEDKKATTKKQFVKVANLDSKNKAFLRKYWKQLFGDDYVNALLADK